MRTHHILSLIAVIVISGTVSLGAGARQAQTNTSAPVEVTNTSAQCVPTSIYHSIALPTLPKNSASTPLFVRDINNSGQHGYQQIFNIDMPPNDLSDYITYVVPTGYTLIITGASSRGAVGNSGQNISLPNTLQLASVDPNTHTSVGNWYGSYVAGYNAFSVLLTPSPVYFVVGQGFTLVVYARRLDFTYDASVDVTLSGQLVKNS